MADALPLNDPSRGRITEGPTTSLVERTLEFVSSELAAWRDDPERLPEDGEERLNAQLCKYLNVAASNRFSMVFFQHEEKQTRSRRVDIAALSKSGIVLGLTYHSIYDPFLVFEGKRLPAPSADREREYVTGRTKKSGGIQRFKLALHGAQQTTAAIVGYVQSGNLREWLSRINEWISEEAESKETSGEDWSLAEQLLDFKEDASLRIAVSSSAHPRDKSAVSPRIQLRHFWVAMAN
ncbi:MAG: hypothetical protein ABSC62_14405 [Terracidiphilus sp.]